MNIVMTPYPSEQAVLGFVLPIHPPEGGLGGLPVGNR
jgi:hypothetical protein